MNQNLPIDLDELVQDAANQSQKTVSLNDVQALAESQKLLEEEIEALEAQVMSKKGHLRQIAEHELPDMLNMVGMSSLTLSDGSVIGIQENISASITDDNREAAHRWLRENNFGDLIKNAVTVTFGKGEDKDAELLVHNINTMADQGSLKFGTLDQKEVVHSSTLKAFVKERLRAGDPIPADTFKLFIGQITRIKKPKVKA